MSSVLEQFQAALNHPLDDFQIAGCQAVERGEGVLVCAPTGAGKTVVGEFAVHLALAKGTKCFYTTPIKALSNQKYHDLVESHGVEAVGLLTGDVSINGDADIVVMTTEVLRNMIYAGSHSLSRLSHVVMDEIHFLADTERGVIWEEVILNLDASVKVVGLSATVSNAEEFGAWLGTVRGSTRVVVSEHRPVPLDQWMMVGGKLFPLFEPDSVGTVNASLVRYVRRIESGDYDHGRDGQGGHAGFRSHTKHGGNAKPARSGRHRQSDRHRPLGRPETIAALKAQAMLPAVYFIFSRAGCDGALYQCLRSRLVLTTESESREIAQIVDAGVEGIPQEDLQVLDFERWKKALCRGFAAHHAGMLPAFRHIVEELFSKGLVRAVFATETLALGINMPARTVVLEKLIKFNGEAHVDLSPGQYTQLTGRAGRRGIDTIGNAVIHWAPAMDPRQVAGLAGARTYPLNSTFQPGYNMAVNLVGLLGYSEAINLIERSFAQYQASGSVVEQAQSLEVSRREAEQARTRLAEELELLKPPVLDDGDILELLMSYNQLRQDLTAAEKKASKDSTHQRRQEVVRVLNHLNPGDVIALPTKKKPLLAVVVTRAQQGNDPRPWVVTEFGWSGRIDSEGIANPPVMVGTLRLPRGLGKNPRRSARIVQQLLADQHFDRPAKLKLYPRSRPHAKVQALRDELTRHPVHSWPAADREQLIRLAHTLAVKQERVRAMSAEVSAAENSLGATFKNIVELLAEMDYLEVADGAAGRQVNVTEEGNNLCHIHCVTDLLVAQCLKRGIWDGLDPAELAGLAALCIFENRKDVRGSFTAPTDAMDDAIAATLRVHKQLVSDERRYGLPITRTPDPSFSLAVHQWTAGAPLGYCLAAAAECGAELSPGDFVRWCRQVVDLLQQCAKTAYNDDLKSSAHAAIDAIRRGVVALGA